MLAYLVQTAPGLSVKRISSSGFLNRSRTRAAHVLHPVTPAEANRVDRTRAGCGEWSSHPVHPEYGSTRRSIIRSATVRKHTYVQSRTCAEKRIARRAAHVSKDRAESTGSGVKKAAAQISGGQQELRHGLPGMSTLNCTGLRSGTPIASGDASWPLSRRRPERRGFATVLDALAERDLPPRLQAEQCGRTAGAAVTVRPRTAGPGFVAD